MLCTVFGTKYSGKRTFFLVDLKFLGRSQIINNIISCGNKKKNKDRLGVQVFK